MENFFEVPALDEKDSTDAFLKDAEVGRKSAVKGENKQGDAGDNANAVQKIADLMRLKDVEGATKAVKEHFSKQPDPDAMKALAKEINENLKETRTGITLSVVPFRAHKKNQAVMIKGLEKNTLEVPVGPGKNAS